MLLEVIMNKKLLFFIALLPFTLCAMEKDVTIVTTTQPKVIASLQKLAGQKINSMLTEHADLDEIAQHLIADINQLQLPEPQNAPEAYEYLKQIGNCGLALEKIPGLGNINMSIKGIEHKNAEIPVPFIKTIFRKIAAKHAPTKQATELIVSDLATITSAELTSTIQQLHTLPQPIASCIKYDFKWKPSNFTRTLLKGHRDISLYCILHKQTLVSPDSLKHGNINTWDLSTGECIKTLVGHTNNVRALVSYNDKLISGSNDCTIKIWNPDSGECLKTLSTHQDYVTALVMDNDNLISGSFDKSIKKWNLDSGECIKTLEHKGEVLALCMHDGNLIYGCFDGTITMVNFDKEQCLKTFNCNEVSRSGILPLLVHNNKLIAGPYTIKIWNIETEEYPKTLNHSTMNVTALVAHNNKLIAGYLDDRIKICDLETGQCITTLIAHNNYITNLLILDGKLVSTSEDTIIIWNLNDKFKDALKNKAAANDPRWIQRNDKRQKNN